MDLLLASNTSCTEPRVRIFCFLQFVMVVRHESRRFIVLPVNFVDFRFFLVTFVADVDDEEVIEGDVTGDEAGEEAGVEERDEEDKVDGVDGVDDADNDAANAADVDNDADNDAARSVLEVILTMTFVVPSLSLDSLSEEEEEESPSFSFSFSSVDDNKAASDASNKFDFRLPRVALIVLPKADLIKDGLRCDSKLDRLEALESIDIFEDPRRFGANLLLLLHLLHLQEIIVVVLK